MAKNRNGPNRKYGKRIELRTEQNESNKTETAVYRFSPIIMLNINIMNGFEYNFCTLKFRNFIFGIHSSIIDAIVKYLVNVTLYIFAKKMFDLLHPLGILF